MSVVLLDSLILLIVHIYKSHLLMLYAVTIPFQSEGGGGDHSSWTLNELTTPATTPVPPVNGAEETTVMKQKHLMRTVWTGKKAGREGGREGEGGGGRGEGVVSTPTCLQSGDTEGTAVPFPHNSASSQLKVVLCKRMQSLNQVCRSPSIVRDVIK